MPFSFSDADLDRIGAVLGVEPQHDGGTARYELFDEESGRSLTLQIRRQLPVPEGLEDQPDNLLTVYAPSSFLQLPSCTGFIVSEELGEVIFFAKRDATVNGLVVERTAGCSIYANVDERLLSTDFTKLPPELTMMSLALSLAETFFDGAEAAE
jgi:hypothetical protein